MIVNLGQVTTTTPELALPSLSLHTSPTQRRLSLDRFNMLRPPTRREEDEAVGSGGLKRYTKFELMTRQPRVLYLDH
ncbi:hypothetical protein TNCV_4469431 [Trichonephila clavipes]|nr:hypothetical protein TNCV_4469431 [Trichonephila clavipes]